MRYGICSPDEMDDALQALGEKRMARYPDVKVVERMPDIFGIDERTYLGFFAWSAAGGGRRWVSRPWAIETSNGAVVTPGDAIRHYIDFKSEGRHYRVQREQLDAIARHRHHPLVAFPGEYRDMIYIDIKAAYWSIMTITGWNVDYYPGQFLGAGWDVRDFPFAHWKVVRNALLAAGRGGDVSIWKPNGLERRRVYGKYPNLSLWALAMDILHGIASDMLVLSPVYIHTDGYIIRKEDYPQARAIMQSWCMDAGIKYQGDVRVWGAGAYQFDGRKPPPDNMRHSDLHFYIYTPDRDFLKPRLRRLYNWRRGTNTPQEPPAF